MIRAYSKLQGSRVPFNLFSQMITFEHSFFGVFPDKYTFTFLITSCAHQMSILHGEIVHGMVMKNGYVSDVYVGNSLVNLYSVFAKMDNASKVFDRMSQRDVFSWTSLVCGYAKNGELSKACERFLEMPVRNEVSWAVLISGFVGSGRYLEALKYFREMLNGDECKVRPNEAVLVCALSACAHLGALDQGNWIHAYIDKNGILVGSNISTALIDMYAKCGRIDCAVRVFDKISRPDVHNFTSLITGLSTHGLGRDALYVFNRMLAQNVKPNEVTILGVLNGCSHSGLVKEGSSVFANMEGYWGIEPKLEHYGCYIDLLARAGYLEKAFGVAKSMQMNPDIVIWRALLSACRIHRDVDIGEHIINHIKELDTNGENGGQVLLSNLYASLGRWERVAQVRKSMVQRENQLDIGCSCIELNGALHEFRVAESCI